MPDVLTPPRRVSARASRVLEGLAARRRRTVRLPEDRYWLLEITSDPADLLRRMHDQRLLHRTERGRYVVAPVGTTMPLQAGPAELYVDDELRAQGDYYIGFLSALIAHRLTDVHSNVIYAAIRKSSTYRATRVKVHGAELHLVRVSEKRWPAPAELERVRTIDGTKEFAWRAGIARTLADALTRPELSGGIETVITAWARARNAPVSWKDVADAARRLGSSTARRAAFLAREIEVYDPTPDLPPPRTAVLLDRTQSFDMPPYKVRRDPATGVLVNVPESHLRGWLTGELG